MRTDHQGQRVYTYPRLMAGYKVAILHAGAKNVLAIWAGPYKGSCRFPAVTLDLRVK